MIAHFIRTALRPFSRWIDARIDTMVDEALANPPELKFSEGSGHIEPADEYVRQEFITRLVASAESKRSLEALALDLVEWEREYQTRGADS